MPQLEQLLEQYPGKVKVVYKNFPLRGHRYARQAALAAMAAHEQGLFWPVHDALFAAYNRLNDQTIRKIVEEAGADMERFDKVLRSGTPQKLISRDISEGVQAGVRGTPTVFINGRRLDNRSPAGFKAMIDRLLQSKK